MDIHVLVLADDLSGALEIASQFAARGVAARVSTRLDTPAGVEPVLVIDTASRHLSPAEAAAVVVQAVNGRTPDLVYKKTDSTLRGNIAAELGALAAAFPERRIVYVPAHPAMGRAVRGGRLHVDGVPVEQTTFAQDRLNPVREGRIAKLLEGLTVEIVDGETPADVDAAAAALVGCPCLPLAVGPAALAAALAGRIDVERQAVTALPRVERCLAINGSLHPVSTLQMEHARGAGWRSVTPAGAAGALRQGGWWLLDTSAIGGTGLERAARTGAVVRQIATEAWVDALIIFGGDTVAGVHAAFGSGDFVSAGEIVPGVAASWAHGLLWLTKPGGFGRREILSDIQERLA